MVKPIYSEIAKEIIRSDSDKRIPNYSKYIENCAKEGISAETFIVFCHVTKLFQSVYLMYGVLPKTTGVSDELSEVFKRCEECFNELRGLSLN